MALVTLSRVVELIPNFPSTDNTVMTDIIAACSDLIERWCNRTFLETAYDELYDGVGGYGLLLNQFPVTKIDQVSGGLTPVLQIRNTTQTASRASFRMDATTTTPPAPKNLYLSSTLNGVTTTHTIVLSTTVTFADLATAINAFSADGWTAAALGIYSTWPVADLYPVQGAFDCRWVGNGYLKLHVWNLSDYQPNNTVGEIVSTFGFSRGYQNYRVKYSAGFATVPEPIQQACAALAVSVYNSRNINANVAGENLGGYSYSNIVDKNFHSLDIASVYALGTYKSHRIAKFKI